MLGYFKPIRRELNAGDLDTYRTAYCSLCSSLRSEYGLVSTALMQSDVLFLAIASGRLECVDATRSAARCPVNPLRRVCVLREAGGTILQAAHISVFTVGVSLLNKRTDVKGGLVTTAASALTAVAFDRSAAALGASDEIGMLGRTLARERSAAGSPDRIIHPICDYYARVTARTMGGDSRVRDIAYDMCRVMYYIDALEDLPRDTRLGLPNPLAGIYQDPGQVRHYATSKVAEALSRIRDHAGGSPHKGLVRNVVDLAVPTRLNRAARQVDRWGESAA